MSQLLKEKFNQLLKKRGYKSLRALDRENNFSFSYEYLRQISLGLKVPSADIIVEIAEALQVKPAVLMKIAAEAKAARVLGKYRSVGATSPVKAADKHYPIYQAISKEDQKLLGLFNDLGTKERDEAWEYLKYLRRKCRQESKKKTPN